MDDINNKKNEFEDRVKLLYKTCEENGYENLKDLLSFMVQENLQPQKEVLDFFECNSKYRFSDLTTGVFKIFLKKENIEKQWFEIILRIEKEYGRDSEKMKTFIMEVCSAMKNSVPVEAVSKIFYADNVEVFRGYCASVIQPEKDSKISFYTALLAYTSELLWNCVENHVSDMERQVVQSRKQLEESVSNKEEISRLNAENLELKESLRKIQQKDEEIIKFQQADNHDNKLNDECSPDYDRENNNKKSSYYRGAFCRLQKQYNECYELCNYLKKKVKKCENIIKCEMSGLAKALGNEKKRNDELEIKITACLQEVSKEYSENKESQPEAIVLKSDDCNSVQNQEDKNKPEELRATVSQSDGNVNIKEKLEVEESIKKKNNIQIMQNFFNSLSELKKEVANI